MYTPEQIEKSRQAIMRLQELLEIMRGRVETGERAYHALFATLTPEQTADLRGKEIQRLVAPLVLDNPKALQRAVWDLQFHSRELEKAFDELSGIVAHLLPSADDELDA